MQTRTVLVPKNHFLRKLWKSFLKRKSSLKKGTFLDEDGLIKETFGETFLEQRGGGGIIIKCPGLKMRFC